MYIFARFLVGDHFYLNLRISCRINRTQCDNHFLRVIFFKCRSRTEIANSNGRWKTPSKECNNQKLAKFSLKTT
ncbi:hypothetical protein ACH3XW_44930 [Acanthocheilonema viteae]